jgi:DNA-directed RNA polymerase specialized sigma24 family protein
MTPQRPTRAPPPAVKASPAQLDIYLPGPALCAAHDRLWPLLRSIAMSLANDDEDFADDLTQEAFIKLWELDPSRFDEADQAYLKRALVTRMLDAVDRERREGRPELKVSADFWLR